ncbi:MAG: polysaccharide deacetylase family protein [Kofleriaceae bacterium]
MRSSLASAACLLPLLASAACLGDGDDHADDGALFEEAYEQNQDGKADGAGCSGVRVPDAGPFGGRIALTFDDGPNPATTPRVLAALRARGLPATFFTNGSRYAAPGAAALAAEIAADPQFILANHSQRHVNLATLSLDAVAREVDGTDALIRTAGDTPRYFRFPFGSATCASAELVRARGYTVTGWHIDSADWCYAAGGGVCKASTFRYVPDALRDDMTGYVMSQVRAHDGGIILFHDIHGHTADALPAILDRLIADGYTFVSLDDEATFPKLHGVTPPFIGTPCETDDACAFTAGGAAGRCHPAGFCTTACEGACPDRVGAAPTYCIADGLAPPEAGPAGTCVSRPAAVNQACAALPQTERRVEARFVGDSGASPGQAEVCAPL